MCDFVKVLVWMKKRGVCEKRGWSWVVRVGFMVFLEGHFWGGLGELSYALLEKSNWARLISKNKMTCYPFNPLKTFI